MITFEAAWERGQREVAAQGVRKVAAQKPAPLAPPPPRGVGWEVLEAPRASHRALEGHARDIWAFVWHGIDWPAGWRVRWGKLDALGLEIGLKIGRALTPAHCAVSVGDRVLGLCLPPLKLILLDEAEQQRRTPRQFDQTIIHELIHSQQDPQERDEVHGPRFAAALKNATDHYFRTRPAARA